MDSHFHFYHSAKGAGRSRLRWLFWPVIAALVLGLSLLAWHLFAPVSLARTAGSLFGGPLIIKGLEVEAAGAQRSLAPGAALELNPAQTLRILRLDSSRRLNYDLSLSSPDFDAGAFLNGPRSFQSLMGPDAFLEPRSFSLQVLDSGREAARFTIKLAYGAADLAALGDRAASPEAKAKYYRLALSMLPDDAEVAAKLAGALADSGVRDAELAGLLEKLLAGAADDAARRGLLMRLLNVYQAEKDAQGEIHTFERLSELAAKTGESQRPYKANLASLCRESDPGRAAALYEELLDGASPEESLSTLSILLALYQKTGSRDKEAQTYERILPLATPEQAPGIWNSLLRLRAAAGDQEGETAAYEGLAAALPAGQTKVDAYKRLGWLYSQRNEAEKARKALEAASALDPKDRDIYMSLAALAAEAGDRDAFRDSLEKAAALSDSASVKERLAQAYTEDGLTDKALEIWLSLAETAPDSEEKTRVRGEARARALELSRPPEGAVSDSFEKLLYQYSWNSVEFYNLGVTHFKRGDWEKAEKAFLHSLDIGGPAVAFIRDTHGYLLAIYKEKGDKAKLLEEALFLYRDDPSQKDYRDLAATELEAGKDWPALEKAAQEWVKIKRDDPDNWRWLALAQKNTGDGKAMAQSLFNAATLEPKSVAAWLAAGDALEQSGDIDKAKTAFQKVIDLDDQNDKATQALLRFTLADLSNSRSRGGAQN